MSDNTAEVLVRTHTLSRMFEVMSLPSFSTPELFSFAHDRRREELWGTLDQALSLFVVGRNKESASDWSICDAVKFERAL